MSVSDTELLRQYIGKGAGQAFAELVRRHFDLVYFTALRRVAGDGELARDVSQLVFMDLARKARALVKRSSLAGWLYTSTLFAAANSVRGEVRRRAREQEAVTMQLSDNAPAIDWHQLQPVLDQAMQQLTEGDREIILLRFFERSDYRTVSATLGISEDAARKRVDRALDKLRGLVGGQGIAPTTATLAALIGTYAVVPAPAGLAGTLTAAALAAAGTGTVLSIGNVILTTKAKLLAATAVAVVGLTAPIILQVKEIQRLKAENTALRTQNAVIAKLRADYDRLAQSGVDPDRLDQMKKDHTELLRLRGEVGRLRGQIRSNPSNTPARNQEANVAKSTASPEPVTHHTAFGHAVLGQGSPMCWVVGRSIRENELWFLCRHRLRRSMAKTRSASKHGSSKCPNRLWPMSGCRD